MSNKSFLNIARAARCVCCIANNTNQDSPTEIDHIRSRGAGGKDEPWNIIPICREHHMKRHRIGLNQMINSEPGYRAWVTYWGWEKFNNKWIAPTQERLSEIMHLGNPNHDGKEQ